MRNSRAYERRGVLVDLYHLTLFQERKVVGRGGEVPLDCLVRVTFWSRIALTLGLETDSNETSKQRCVIK